MIDLVLIQKTVLGYNLLFSTSDYRPEILTSMNCTGLQEVYDNNNVTSIPADIDFDDMVECIKEMCELFENKTRTKGISSYKYTISELARLYVKHGYDITRLTDSEKEADFLAWGIGLAAEIKELGFRHQNTSCSNWSYTKGDFTISIPYTNPGNWKKEAAVYYNGRDCKNYNVGNTQTTEGIKSLIDNPQILPLVV